MYFFTVTLDQAFIKTLRPLCFFFVLDEKNPTSNKGAREKYIEEKQTLDIFMEKLMKVTKKTILHQFLEKLMRMTK